MQSMFLVWGSAKKNRRLWGFVLTVWLSFCIQLTAGQVSISPPVQDAAVGGKATLSVQTTARVTVFTWYRGTGVSDLNKIIIYIPGFPRVQNFGVKYTSREKVLPNGDLEITALLKSYTGNYTLQIVRSDFITQQATAQLRVYEPVTKPTVRYISSQLVENRGPAVITCDTSNAADMILWFFNNRPLLPGNIRMSLSADNRSLTIASVSRSDSGIYQCEALNPFSARMSDPETLIVAWVDDATDWTMAVGVSLGILLVAALIATGVVLFYKRSKRTQKALGESTYENPEMIQGPDPQYENVREGSPGQSLNLTADSAYMDLTHRDLATYEQLKRSKT